MSINKISEIYSVVCDTCGFHKEIEVMCYADLKHAMETGTTTLHFLSECESLKVQCSTCKRKGVEGGRSNENA